MNVMKTFKLVKTILSFEIDIIKLLNYIDQQFGREVKIKVGTELNKINLNRNGKIDFNDLLLLILKKFK